MCASHQAEMAETSCCITQHSIDRDIRIIVDSIYGYEVNSIDAFCIMSCKTLQLAVQRCPIDAEDAGGFLAVPLYRL